MIVIITKTNNRQSRHNKLASTASLVVSYIISISFETNKRKRRLLVTIKKSKSQRITDTVFANDRGVIQVGV